MKKKVPVLKMRTIREAQDKVGYLNFYPFEYAEMWAIEALKLIDGLPLKFFPYSSRQPFFDSQLHFKLDRKGRYAHRTLRVRSFFELFKVIAWENISVMNSDFFVDLPRYRQQRYDRFLSNAEERKLISYRGNILDAFMNIEKALKTQRRFKGQSPNSSHPRAVYLSRHPSVIFSGNHYVVPTGISFEFDYSGEGGWDYMFLGDVDPDMFNWPKSKDRDFLKAILRMWDFIKNETEEVDLWKDLWQKMRRLKPPIAFWSDKGHLFGKDGGSIDLLPEQKTMLASVCKAKRFTVGTKEIRPVPAKNDFWGKGYILKGL